MGDKNTGKGTPGPNPAQGIKTQPLPIKTARDSGKKVILNTPKGKEK